MYKYTIWEDVGGSDKNYKLSISSIKNWDLAQICLQKLARTRGVCIAMGVSTLIG